MSNEELVCTPDLVVSNLRLNYLKKCPAGTKIQVQDPILLMPPIVTDVHEKCSLISDNFRLITRSILENIDKTRSKVEDIEKKLESVTVDVYRNAFEQCLNEINRTICSLNVSKNQLMIDRVNLLGQSKIDVGDSIASFNQPNVRNGLFSRKISQTLTKAVNSATNVSTAPTKSPRALAAILNNSKSIPNCDSLNNTTVHKKEDIEILKRQEKLKIRRIKRTEKRLLKRMQPCHVKIRKVDLTKLRDDYIRSKSKTSNSINNIIVSQINGEHMDVDTDQNQNFVNGNPQPVSEPEQKTNPILKNDTISIQSILVSSSPVNVTKISKSVSFAPDVIFDTSS